MARPEGFEPPTPTFVALYSIQLSYGRALRTGFYHLCQGTAPRKPPLAPVVTLWSLRDLQSQEEIRKSLIPQKTADQRPARIFGVAILSQRSRPPSPLSPSRQQHFAPPDKPI